MKYSAWTARAVEDRVVEAQETLMLLPAARGPKAFGGAWPEVQKDWQNYGQEPSRYKRRASRDAIDRMPETWAWVNTYLDESERKLVYAWAWVKVQKGKKISAFAQENCVNERTLRRIITSYFQKIARELNLIHAVRLENGDCQVSENYAHEDADSVDTVRRESPTHWRAPDAKPQNLPEMHSQEPRRARAG